MTKTHIIYISGLGDHLDRFRRLCLGLWKYPGVSVQHVPMTWMDGKSYDEKFASVSQAIDVASTAGKRVVLIGESAGGSMAVNMYAARAGDLYRVMTLCGKNQGMHGVSPRYYRRNPAFQESMRRTEASIEKLTDRQRQEFISITPLSDPTVPIRDTLLPGCRHVRLWAVGHFVPITMALTVYSWIVVRLATAELPNRHSI